MAARHADVWHAWARLAEFARKNAVLDRLGQDIGRCPADVAGPAGTMAVRTSQSREHAAGLMDVRGRPEDVLSQLLAFRDAGVGEFIVRDDAANVPAWQVLTQIDVLTQAVLPQLTW